MAIGSTGLAQLLLFFPQIQKELDAIFKDPIDKVSRHGFWNSKEKVIIAEVLLKKMPGLREDYQKDLVSLIKDARNSAELKTRLKHWKSSTTEGSSSLWSSFISFFSSKEEPSEYLDRAVSQSRRMKDQEFLSALPGKVSEEPLLEQLAQDVLMEAHGYFQEFVKHHLPKLYSRVHVIKQQTMYHQVEAEVNDQDQKRRASARSDWFDEVKMNQPQVDSGYVQYITSVSDITEYVHQIPGYSVYPLY